MEGYGRELSYFRYKNELLASSGISIRNLKASCSVQDILIAIECGNYEGVNTLLQGCDNFKGRPDLVQQLLAGLTLNIVCYSKLFCCNMVSLRQMCMDAVLSSASQYTISQEVNAEVNAEVNEESIALIDYAALITKQYSVDTQECGCRFAMVYNAALLMGYSEVEPKLTPIINGNLGSGVEPRSAAASAMSKVSSLVTNNHQKWWMTLFATRSTQVGLSIVQAVTLCAKTFLKKENSTDINSIILHMILAIGADYIHHLNGYVAGVIQEIFDRMPLDKIILQSNSTPLVAMLDEECTPYTFATRESLKMFTVVQWILDKPGTTLNRFGTGKLLQLLGYMPIISYEMLPVVSTLIYAYLHMDNADLNEYSDLIIGSSLYMILDKVHCGDNLLSLIVHRAIRFPMLYDNRRRSQFVEQRLKDLMSRVISMDYLARDTILGNEMVVHHLCKAIKNQNPFCCRNAKILISKLSQTTALQIRNRRLVAANIITHMNKLLPSVDGAQ